ncbi:uncharacterized protein [Primulina eburnea]|uniref:uncharacterized protein n=1 Tax=Primulina eburnea TaxID=1245227 RepID=UPI003C6BDE09
MLICETISQKTYSKILIFIVTDSKVFVMIMFDRAARALFGCSAGEFLTLPRLILMLVHRVRLHSKTDQFWFYILTSMTAGRVLEGEMLTVTLSNPNSGNAQHQRVVSVVPLRTGFQPAIETMRESYHVRGVS